MTLTAAITYGHNLDGRETWNIRELDHNEEPRLSWYTGDDFYAEGTKVLQAAGVDVQIVPYGDVHKGVVGYILAASADVGYGPVSSPFSMACFANVDLAEHDARLAAALAALGITPTEPKPGWITSACQGW